MTTLAQVRVAARLADERAALVYKRNSAKLGVTLDGTYQDDDMIAAVHPCVRGELDRRIAEIDEDLAAIGVEVA